MPLSSHTNVEECFDKVASLSLQHTHVINQIAVDEEGEFLATASDDGKVHLDNCKCRYNNYFLQVHITGLFVKYNLSVEYDTPAKVHSCPFLLSLRLQSYNGGRMLILAMLIMLHLLV